MIPSIIINDMGRCTKSNIFPTGVKGKMSVAITIEIVAMNRYFPGRLFSWGATLLMGGNATAWPAFGISLGLIATALLVACLIFRRQEV